jgi:hypothetical protein
VAVARVIVGVQLAQVQREMPRYMRAVDDCSDPGRSSASTQLLDRKSHGCRGRVVAEEECACPRARPCPPDCVDDLFRTPHGKSNGCAHVPRAEVSADVLPGEVERALLEIGGEHLVAPARARAGRRRRSVPPLRSGRTLGCPDQRRRKHRAPLGSLRAARPAGGRETAPAAARARAAMPGSARTPSLRTPRTSRGSETSHSGRAGTRRAGRCRPTPLVR